MSLMIFSRGNRGMNKISKGVSRGIGGKGAAACTHKGGLFQSNSIKENLRVCHSPMQCIYIVNTAYLVHVNSQKRQSSTVKRLRRHIGVRIAWRCG